MSKKAQITMFIIIGLAVLTLVSISFFLFTNETKDKEINGNLNHLTVNDYIEDQLKQISSEAILKSSLQGGFLFNYDEKLITEEITIAVHSKEKIMEKESIKKQIERYISEKIYNNLKTHPFYYYELEIFEPETEILITENEVIVNLNMKVIINNEIEINTFNSLIDFRLDYLLNIKDEILENDPVTSDLTLYDIEINIIPFNRDFLIYSLVDHKSKYKDRSLTFNYAVKNKKNQAPILNFIPDFRTDFENGINYTLSVRNYGNKEFFFSVDNEKVILDEITGHFLFYPTESTSLKFCVTDLIDEDCRTIEVFVDG